MKKNLLIAAVVLPLMSVSAQWTQVGGTVKVEPNTLKYVKQDYKVAGTSTTINEGWVNVRGGMQTDIANNGGTIPGATNPGFHNIWTSRNEYGQLIVNAASLTAGKIENQYNIPPDLDFVGMAFPFKGYTANEAADQAGIPETDQEFFAYVAGNGNDGFMPGRWSNTVWSWHNVTTGDPKDFYFENANEEGFPLLPYNYHGLNGMGYDQENNTNSEVAGTHGFVGVPANEEYPVSFTSYSITTSGDVNNVGELYSSYVGDVLIDEPTDWTALIDGGGDATGVDDGVQAGDYGANVALFGNPYTSNINLDGKLQNISHVWIINDNGYTPDVEGETADANVKVATLDSNGVAATGEKDILIMRPQQPFFVRGVSSETNFGFTFGESFKTFQAKTNTFVGTTTSRTNNDNGFYQATLRLYNSAGNYANNETYVFASDVIEPNTVSRYEAYNNEFGGLGFYSLQENADGTVDQELIDAHTLINGVNATDYVAKPINLVFEGNGEFTIKGELTQNLINSGNTFYFEDRQTGDIFEVTPDFEYTFTSNGIEDDRFFMYWNGTPDVMAVDDVTLTSQTRVYKNNDQFSVRFADNWNKADIYVYNILGQLVHTAKQVNANQDYLLPLKGQASAYVVKAVSENGEVATQKIIKK